MADGQVIYEVRGDTSQFNDDVKRTENIASKAAKGITTAFAAGTAAAAVAVGALAKSAIEGFAEYEQLVGGVDTLFKGASAQLQGYAAEAYATAGMSANDTWLMSPPFLHRLLILWAVIHKKRPSWQMTLLSQYQTTLTKWARTFRLSWKHIKAWRVAILPCWTI